jgi:hypothetical protein
MDGGINDLAMLFGTRSRYVGTQWPLKCSICGSEDITSRPAPEHLPRDTVMGKSPGKFHSSRMEHKGISLEILLRRERD